MKTKYIVLSLLLSLQLAWAQNYEKSWRKVEAYELKGEVKSANELVKTIYAKAKKKDDASQLIKSLLYLSKFSLKLEEDAELKIEQLLKQEIANSSFPNNAILQSILANFKWEYLQRHRWKIYRRSERTDVNEEANDFRTFSINTLFKSIHKDFSQSISKVKELQAIDLNDYNYILLKSNPYGTKTYQSNLYDLLTDRALEFFQSTESKVTTPKEPFLLNKKEYLAPPKDFVSLQIKTKDSIFSKVAFLKTIQKLEQYHLKNNNENALIKTYLNRLNFIKSSGQIRGINKHYIATLENLKLQVSKNSDVYNEVIFNLAQAYYNKSNLKTHPTYRKKALNLVKEITSKGNDSIIYFEAELLQKKILKKHLNTKSEAIVPTLKHARLWVEFNNINTAHIAVYNAEKLDLKNQYYRRNERVNEFISKNTPINTKSVKLPQVGDYFNHSTEISLPPLKAGNYLIALSSTEDINGEDTWTWQTIQVSNLACIEANLGNDKIFQVVHRVTGKPIKNALVSFGKTKQYTNYKGEVKFSAEKRNEDVRIKYKNDQLFLGSRYNYVYKRNKGVAKSARSFLFLDRSIYRPGQEVYFKGIVLAKNGDENEVVANETFEVEVSDANYEDFKTISVTTNEFGTFSGSFILPKNVLTGAFTIEVFEDSTDFNRFNDGKLLFQVEEYKRPKFEVKLNPIDSSYVLGQKILVTGKATSFSGATISNAEVEYSIKRSKYERYWSSSDDGYEIDFGEVTTDDEGNFEFSFIAEADPYVKEREQPIFEFKINADVTDVNGETRSNSINAKIGYHATAIEILTNEKWNKKEHNDFTVTTKNLNDEDVSADVTIEIYQLNEPKRVLKQRLLPVPDQPILSKEAFIKLYPNEPYTNEHISDKWKQLALVYTKKLNTGNTTKVNLKGIKKWEAGSYSINVTSKDPSGKTITSKKIIRVLPNQSEENSTNKTFDYDIVNPKTFESDGYIEVLLKSAYDELNAFTEVKYGNDFIYQNWNTINRLKTIQIPFKRTIENKNINDVKITFSIVKNNRSQFYNTELMLKLTPIDFEFETLVFRNKIYPGNKEQWRFKVKDYNTQMEVLASMYDSSLDQFKSHQWSRRLLSRNKSTYLQNRESRGFRTQRFNLSRVKGIYANNNNVNKYYTKYLNLYGFGLDSWANRNYLSQLSDVSYQETTTVSGVEKGYIAGNVIDIDGLPLPAAVVLIKGTTTGTTTDFDGNFKLKVPKGATLEVSFVGYAAQTVKVGDFNYVKFTLEPENALEEVVVTAQGVKREKRALGYAVTSVKKADIIYRDGDDIGRLLKGKALGVRVGTLAGVTGENKNIIIRGYSSISDNNQPLFIINGVPFSPSKNIGKKSSFINPENIENINILKGLSATALYGEEGKNGVVLINTKGNFSGNYNDLLKFFKEQREIALNMSAVKARKDLKETAFFYPHLRTNKDGEFAFEFDAPEALTQWKLQLFGHSKNGRAAYFSDVAVTQKELMIVPNLPRFLRAGDQVNIQAKIVSLSEDPLNGIAKIELYDAVTGKTINEMLLTDKKEFLEFDLKAKANATVNWTLTIPEDISAIEYKILAKAGDFTDGEINILPVLTNKMLVTESIPITVKSKEEKQYTIEKLLNPKSDTQKNHQLTLEYTSNPIWFAIQSLPYLMEFPHECAEQTFARFYANTLGASILNSDPKIKEVFDSWRAKEQPVSKLAQNEELKQLLLAETPWLLDAQSENEKMKRLALLFDLEKMNDQKKSILKKLKQMQSSNGAFPWFSGGKDNYYITKHIISGFGHLQKLNVIKDNKHITKITSKGIEYIDREFLKSYREKLKYQYNNDINKLHVSSNELHFLYTRSFYNNSHKTSKELKAVIKTYTNHIKKSWLNRSLLDKAMIALILNRYDTTKEPQQILKHLKETAITSDTRGMYWKENENGRYWYQAPIENQALIIEAFTEISEDNASIEELKIWLLNNKRKNSWDTTKSTTKAIYALILDNENWATKTSHAKINIGSKEITTNTVDSSQKEAGSGYYKTSWNASEIEPEMAQIQVKNEGETVQFGSIHWQYFENLDKISTNNNKSEIQLTKKLFKKLKNSDDGDIEEITQNNLKVGDLVRVRIELNVADNFEFVHLKDMRAAAFEPIDVISKYKWQDGLGYYQSTKDTATHFFFSYLPKGVHVIEYDVRVNNAGDFSNGISTIQSMYAPEFSSHSNGIKVLVN